MDLSIYCSESNFEPEVKEYAHTVFEQIQSISPAGSIITLIFTNGDQGVVLDVNVESNEVQISKKLHARSLFVAVDRAVAMLRDELQSWWHHRHNYACS